jgi:2-haloacid dehalogenase
MREYVPFWQMTQDALDYTIATLGIQDEKLRQKLLDVYWELNAFPEVPDMLRALKAGGMKTAILTNGSPEVVNGTLENARIMDLLDETFSVDMVKIYKPHPDVYQMVPDMFDVDATRVCFMSSNAWNATAAANFGFRVVWINLYNQPPENIPGTQEHMLPTLEGLPALLGL